MIEAKRILIVEVNWLGDVLFSTPFIRAVRNNFPGAYIACMVVPRCKEVLAGNPNINEIIYYDVGAGLAPARLVRGRTLASRRSRGQGPPLRSFWENIKFIKRLKGYRFDTVFLLHRSFTRALLVYLAGIKQRIGYYTFKRAFLLTRKPAPVKAALHRADYYLGLLGAVGLGVDGEGCDFFIGPQDSKWADGFLAAAAVESRDKIIVFNPGGNWLPKRWPKENFVSLGKKLLAYFSGGVKILITGSQNDAALAESIAVSLGRGCVSAAGKATLKQSAALFRRADLVISGDSGPLHLAVAVGANVIGIYGPTSPAITGPYKPDEKRVKVLYKDVGCRIPCYDANCRDYKCMAAIIPDEVFEAVKQMLKSNRNTIDIQ